MTPSGRVPGPDGFRVAGVDLRTCPGTVRDRLFVAETGIPDLSAALREAGLDAPLMVLATCDRVEVYALAGRDRDVRGAVTAALAATSGLPAGEVGRMAHGHAGLDAVRHLFRITAALESDVIGESQILGQVRSAHRVASGLDMMDENLERVLDAAYAAARRIRTETGIARGAVSLAASALRIAQRIHGDLAGCRVAVIGAGELSRLLVERFRDAGVLGIVACDRTPARVEAFARETGAHVTDFGQWTELLSEAEIVMTANGDGRQVITRETVRRALRRRRFRPVFVLDLAVPCDVEASAHEIEGLYVYDLDDLERLALEGQAGRHALVSDAETILDEEIVRFLGEFRARDAVPLIRDVRDAFEAERRQLLRDRPGLDAAEATRLLTNRLLHRPSRALREIARGEGLNNRTESLVRTLLVPAARREGENGES